MSPSPAPPPGDPALPVGELFELAPGLSVPASMVALSFSRSSGPGGQNVNKLATKAELRLRIDDLPITPGAVSRLANLAGRRLTADRELIIVSESERSQSRNRAECFAKLREMLVAAMAPPKVRKKTRPSRGSKERRLKAKKERGETKRRRSDPDAH